MHWLRQKHSLTSSSKGSGQYLLHQQRRDTQDDEGLIQAHEIKLETQTNSPIVSPRSSEGGLNTDTCKPLDNTQTFTDTQLAQAVQICSF